MKTNAGRLDMFLELFVASLIERIRGSKRYEACSCSGPVALQLFLGRFDTTHGKIGKNRVLLVIAKVLIS